MPRKKVKGRRVKSLRGAGYQHRSHRSKKNRKYINRCATLKEWKRKKAKLYDKEA